MLFTSILLDWYNTNGRDLPWRHTKDPYAIWLSEIILQQTRVQQGRSYWEKFMTQWHEVDSLANATEDEILKAWQGLGYYSRARNLHKAAQQIKTLGGFPTSYKELKKLKGVGDYTAAAIASFAFDEAVAVVDGNVYRVLSRYFGIDTPIDSSLGKKEFAILAQELISHHQPANYNQAIMDFGSLQCVRLHPKCHICPLQETCVAFREQRIDSLPVKSKKIKKRERHLDYVYIQCHNEIAIRQRTASDIWQGLWEFPQISDIPQYEQERFANASIVVCNNIKHILTHQVLYADLHLWITDSKPILSSNYKWIHKEDINYYALPRLIELLLEQL